MKEKPKAKPKAKTVRKSKTWQPHAKQIKMSELLLNPEDRRSKQDKCNEVGITTKTLWEWMKNENYVAYVNNKLDQFTNAELPEVWKSLITQCKRGNVPAIKLYYEMKKLHPDIMIKFASFDLEREKLELLKIKNGSGEDAIAQGNKQITMLADLINNPAEDRHIEDFENE